MPTTISFPSTATATDRIRGDRQPLTTTARYREAEATVDQLADAGFPIQHVRIVGRDLHSVEQVTGPTSSRRSAGAGAASGAWFGLLLGVFLPGAGWIVLLLASTAFGALWGSLSAWWPTWSPGGGETSPPSRTSLPGSTRYSSEFLRRSGRRPVVEAAALTTPATFRWAQPNNSSAHAQTFPIDQQVREQ